MEWFPGVLVTAVSVQVFCQLFKLGYYSVRDGRLRLSYFVTAGGIPSAHSAFVTALAVAIGMRNGFASTFVFSAIVIYDAFRLRGHVQRHAEIINAHLLKPAGEEPISEMVGHSITEIVTGVLLGGGVSAVVTFAIQ
jgi:acid phosphatase family membrane protein YuiD